MNTIDIYVGDAITQLKRLPTNSVNCVVTSPPYWNLRNYGSCKMPLWGDGWSGHLGDEPTPNMFVNHLIEVFYEVQRILADDGICFVNLGDSYVGSGKGFGVYTNKNKNNKGSYGIVSKPVSTGLKAKDMALIPQRFAIAMQDAGWWVRSEIIWAKPSPMPESVKDRPCKAHESIWMFTKSEKYFYNHEAVKEPVALSTIGRKACDFGGEKGRNRQFSEKDPSYRKGHEQWGKSFDLTGRATRNLRTVWMFPNAGFSAKNYGVDYAEHFAVFPPKLPERCIKAGCPKDGIVLDPFMGSGTTNMVAAQLGFDSIGIELNPDYADIAHQRLLTDVGGLVVTVNMKEGVARSSY